MYDYTIFGIRLRLFVTAQSTILQFNCFSSRGRSHCIVNTLCIVPSNYQCTF